MDQVRAQNHPQLLELCRGHLTEPQALPVLNGQGQRVPQRPAAFVGGQQVLGAGDLSELGDLCDVESCQVTDTIDDRHGPQDLWVQDVALGYGQLRDRAQGHQAHHGGAGGRGVFGHWDEPRGVGARCAHPVSRYGSLLTQEEGPDILSPALAPGAQMRQGGTKGRPRA